MCGNLTIGDSLSLDNSKMLPHVGAGLQPWAAFTACEGCLSAPQQLPKALFSTHKQLWCWLLQGGICCRHQLPGEGSGHHGGGGVPYVHHD